MSETLSSKGYRVLGIDNINSYYDIKLKKNRINHFLLKNDIEFKNIDLADYKEISKSFNNFKPDIVINLAAQAGVRYSIENPFQYAQSNLLGFSNVIEISKLLDVEHFIYASSSSVYGNNTNERFKESDDVSNPESFYAATKISNELISKSYSNLFNMKCSGLRFFTAYGPWGRPDMAYFLFTKNIIEGKQIDVYGQGKLLRDYTYITDIVEAIFRIMKIEDPDSHNEIFNIGNENPIILNDFIKTLENIIGIEAITNFMPIQKGDVYKTSSDTSKLYKKTGFKPQVGYEEGLLNFYKWYKGYYET